MSHLGDMAHFNLFEVAQTAQKGCLFNHEIQVNHRYPAKFLHNFYSFLKAGVAKRISGTMLGGGARGIKLP